MVGKERIELSQYCYYWNKKDETNEVIKGGWLHTGDIGEFTKEGNLNELNSMFIRMRKG